MCETEPCQSEMNLIYNVKGRYRNGERGSEYDAVRINSRLSHRE